MVLIPASSPPTATAQSGSWGPPLLGAGFLYRILAPTDLISNWLTSCLHPGYIIVRRKPSFLWASQIALIQPAHGQSYILIFLERMHLLFTQVLFLFWQLGRDQYVAYVMSSIYTGCPLLVRLSRNKFMYIGSLIIHGTLVNTNNSTNNNAVSLFYFKFENNIQQQLSIIDHNALDKIGKIFCVNYLFGVKNHTKLSQNRCNPFNMIMIYYWHKKLKKLIAFPGSWYNNNFKKLLIWCIKLSAWYIKFTGRVPIYCHWAYPQ